MSDLHLTQLGRAVDAPASPADAVLERVPNPQKGQLYAARFTAPEFTSLCPVTGQPDFARLVIDYTPAEWLIESKSLKLYLASFRNHGAFHEDCTIAIGRKLAEVAAPTWLRIGGYWYPERRHPDRRVLADRPGAGRDCGCRIRASRPTPGDRRLLVKSRAGSHSPLSLGV